MFWRFLSNGILVMVYMSGLDATDFCCNLELIIVWPLAVISVSIERTEPCSIPVKNPSHSQFYSGSRCLR